MIGAVPKDTHEQKYDYIMKLALIALSALFSVGWWSPSPAYALPYELKKRRRSSIQKAADSAHHADHGFLEPTKLC